MFKNTQIPWMRSEKNISWQNLHSFDSYIPPFTEKIIKDKTRKKIDKKINVILEGWWSSPSCQKLFLNTKKKNLLSDIDRYFGSRKWTSCCEKWQFAPMMQQCNAMESDLIGPSSQKTEMASNVTLWWPFLETHNCEHFKRDEMPTKLEQPLMMVSEAHHC